MSGVSTEKAEANSQTPKKKGKKYHPPLPKNLQQYLERLMKGGQPFHQAIRQVEAYRKRRESKAKKFKSQIKQSLKYGTKPGEATGSKEIVADVIATACIKDSGEEHFDGKREEYVVRKSETQIVGQSNTEVESSTCPPESKSQIKQMYDQHSLIKLCFKKVKEKRSDSFSGSQKRRLRNLLQSGVKYKDALKIVIDRKNKRQLLKAQRSTLKSQSSTFLRKEKAFPPSNFVQGYFPHSDHHTTFEILTFIRVQNKLDTAAWKVVSIRRENGTFCIRFLVDKTSWLLLEKTDGEIWYRFSRIKLILEKVIEPEPSPSEAEDPPKVVS